MQTELLPELIPWAIMIAKVAFVVIVLLHVAPVMAWVERRGSALMQNRLGPNRVGPLGLFHSLADAVKFLRKEDPIPGHVEPFYYVMAPWISLIPAFMTFAVIPFAGDLMIGDMLIKFQVADLNVGLLYILSIASLGVYGIIMGGWASNNKYALLGSLRSSAQMISYELSMGLSIIGIVMAFATVNLGEIAALQGQALLHLGPVVIPKWGVFFQPIGCLIFFTCIFAETNRLPFDLPEGESEIVAGYHLEYGSMKFAMFMMAEYINMLVASAFFITLYFGGWQLLPGMQPVLDLLVEKLALDTTWADVARVAFQFGSFSIKVGFMMWVYVWVRWTLPRFRYDQVMDLGWKIMLPLSLANILLTGGMIYMGWV